TIIISGTPGGSAKPGREADECMPPSLRGDSGSSTGAVELLAADLRPGGDGRRLAILKIVAGLIGVELDDLVQRDAHRRVRQFAALSGVSLALAATMAGMTAEALRARNEAVRQRRDAQSLVEFMLGDLKRRLAPVNKLEVLDALGG